MSAGGDLRARHATGGISIAHDIWYRSKWTVYNERGVPLARFNTKREAERFRLAFLDADSEPLENLESAADFLDALRKEQGK